MRREFLPVCSLFLLSCGRPDAPVLRVDAAGRMELEGRPIALADLPARTKDDDTQPLRLDVDPSLRMGDLKSLLLRLIVDGRRVNLGFLVRSATGTRVLTLPIQTDHGCAGLTYYDGERKYDEHGLKGAKKHLWVGFRIGPGGRLLPDGVDRGTYNVIEKILEMAAEVEDPVYRRDSEEGVPPPPPPPPAPKPPRPTLPRPQDGSTGALTRFFKDPAVVALDPYVELNVWPGDRVGDFLEGLGELRKAAGDRVLVSLRLGAP